MGWLVGPELGNSELQRGEGLRYLIELLVNTSTLPCLVKEKLHVLEDLIGLHMNSENLELDWSFSKTLLTYQVAGRARDVEAPCQNVLRKRSIWDVHVEFHMEAWR